MRWLIGLAVLALWGTAQAQCPADADLDWTVRANEITRLVTQHAPSSDVDSAIEDVFAGCGTECPLRFTDVSAKVGYACRYSGLTSSTTPYNNCTVEGVEAVWTSDGSNIVITFLNVRVANFPGGPSGRLQVGATRKTFSSTTANLVGWWTEVDPDIVPISGSVRTLSPLVISFGASTLKINGCALKAYAGEFTGGLSLSP